MKNAIFFSMFTLVAISFTSAAKFTITNQGTTFSPANISISITDTVEFDLGSMHNAVEVTKETYDANDDLSNGGFSVPLGGGTVIFNTAGIFYYVCQPHADLQMKGIITVSEPTGINPTFENLTSFSTYPNPIINRVRLTYWLESNAKVSIDLLSVSGKKVMNLVSEESVSGLHERTYAIPSTITPGVYFLKLSIANRQIVNKVLIIAGN